jgi:hypothetical protein
VYACAWFPEADTKFVFESYRIHYKQLKIILS